MLSCLTQVVCAWSLCLSALLLLFLSHSNFACHGEMIIRGSRGRVGNISRGAE